MSTSNGKEMATTKEIECTSITAPSRTIERFDGQDYQIWAEHMKDLLEEWHLIDYLDVKENIPNYQQSEDPRALAEIRFTLSNSQMRLVINCTTAHDAW